MNEFGGTFTERSARKSPPARGSSHARAWGTRSFIASHFARDAFTPGFDASTIEIKSREEIFSRESRGASPAWLMLAIKIKAKYKSNR
jgi:hypothetical protein